MTGGEKRRFCKQCSTHVHDLTDYSEEEILALKVQNGGKLCGAFRVSKPVVKPLTIGAGIATLALASCQPEPLHTVGIITPPISNSETEHPSKTKEEPPKVGESVVDAPPTNTKRQPQIETPAIHKNHPQEGAILGKIVPPKAPDPELPLIMGDICLPEEVPPKSNNSIH